MDHRRVLRTVPILIAVVLATAPVAGSPQQASAAPQQATAPPSAVDAERTFRDVLNRFYDACSRKDLPAVERTWHSQGPARRARNVLEVDFELRSIRLLGLSLREVSVDSGGGRAHAVIELAVTDAKTNQTRAEWRVRDFTFLLEDGVWKIWNEAGSSATAGAQLARRLLSTPAAERDALVASSPELRTDESLAGLGAEGVRLRSQGNLDEAADAMSARAGIARGLSNLPVLAATLQDIGLVRQVQGRHDEAARAISEARDLFARVGTRLDVAGADANLASVDYVRGDYASAARRYREVLDVYEAENETARVASTLHSYGNALYMLGEFEQALAAYQRSLSMHEQAANKYSASSVLQAIALVHKEVGNFAAAIDAYGRSAALSLDVEDIVGAARAEHGLGEAYRLTGDFSRALQHFSASLALWEKTPDTPNRASTLYAAGHAYAQQRDFGRAIERYQEALRLDEQAGERGGAARDLGGLGGAHSGQGQIGLALEEYGKSLALREQLKDSSGAMWTVVHIGVLKSAQARHSEALEAYQRALQAAEAAGDSGAVSTILALRGANELVREDVQAAIASAGKAAEIASRAELFDVLSFARLTAGKALRRAGRNDEARQALEESVAALERVPVGPATDTFFDDRRAPYAALVDLLVSENRGADAFRWSERARVRALALLLGADGSVVTKGLTQGERDEERRLDRDNRALLARLARERAREKPDEERLARLREAVERSRIERETLKQRLFEAHAGLAALRGQVDPAGIDVAGRTLASSEALVSFLVTDTRTHAFVVVRDPASTGAALARVTTIETSAGDLAARVIAFRGAIASRDVEFAQQARELYSLLLEPLAPQIARVRALTIVPDAFLWTLPFEALQDGAGRHLVQRAAISYAPSLTALSAMRSTPPSGPRPRPFLLAVGDPVVTPSAQARLAVFRTSAAVTPSTRREVTSLAAVFGPAASRALLGPQARADRLAAGARPGTMAHLGVPLFLNDASPLYSLIAMPHGDADRTDDELLEVGDVMGWTLPADFATLSRVEQRAAGASGEQLMALAWALFVAGTPTTVVGRWMPAGTGGLKVTLPFYRAWASPAAARRTPAEAMQRAAKSLIAQPGSHPQDWAGLMVIGR